MKCLLVMIIASIETGCLFLAAFRLTTAATHFLAHSASFTYLLFKSSHGKKVDSSAEYQSK